MQKKLYLLKIVSMFFLLSTLAHSTELPAEAFGKFAQSMDVVVNDYTYDYSGTGTTSFVNNSPDTLYQLFYHAYFNAFQPKSAMAAYASQNGASTLYAQLIALQQNQYGSLDIDSCTINSRSVTITRTGTIIRLDLPHPLAPGDSAYVRFSFRGHIPLITRRAGRNSIQGIRYSMAQWYPKLCQYDEHGWHNNQYVGKEFYGVFGRYDVRITLPARYIVGATGELQNPIEIGHGYQYTRDTTVFPNRSGGLLPKDSLATWHFVADNVHDFAWVADENYAHTIAVRDSITIHVLYTASLHTPWKPVADWCNRSLRFFGERYGAYPYRSFTCAQAGDGGMEYPQLITITNRTAPLLLRVIVHEIGHQWFYGLIANNEAQHAWMDEGFTNYIEERAVREEFADAPQSEIPLLQRLLVPERPAPTADHLGYLFIAETGLDEPLTTPHDRFNDNYASRVVYDKGAALLRQLEYAFGTRALDSCLRYYALTQRFRHPYPHHFQKACEHIFGQRLDEFFYTFVATTQQPDYTLHSLNSHFDAANNTYSTTIELRKKGIAHLPLTLYLRLADGSWTTHHIPSDVQYTDTTTRQPWFWTHTSHTTTVRTPTEVQAVYLDTTNLLIDATASDNYLYNRFFMPQFPPMRFGLWQRYDYANPLHYYGVSVRPTLWHTAPNNWQVGLRLDGHIDFNRWKTILGAYYNTALQTTDWQVQFNNPLSLFGKNISYNLRSWQMDGTQHGSIALNKQYKQRYTAHEQWSITAAAEYWFFSPTTIYPTTSEFFRLYNTVRHSWEQGAAALTVTVAGTERATGSRTSLQFHHVANYKSGWQLYLRTIGSTATTHTPAAELPLLHTASRIEQFENIPFRFVRMALPATTPLFFPQAGTFASFRSQPLQHFASMSLEAQQFSLFRNLGIDIPVISNTRVGAYVSSAVGVPHNSSTGVLNEFFCIEMGLQAGIDLNSIIPYSKALWLFNNDLTFSVWLPMLSHTIGHGATTSTRGISMSMSSTL